MADALLLAPIETSIAMLALGRRGTVVPFATIDRDDSGNALTVDAAESRLAVARCPAFRRCRTNVGSTVFVLATLTDGATFALAAENGSDSGEALAVEATESWFTIARGSTFPFRRATALAAISMLARATGRTTIAFATENFDELGDTLTVTADQSRLAVAS